MTVLEKKTKRIVDVYDIRYDKTGYPTFLYYQDGQWLQRSAKYFAPNFESNRNFCWERIMNNDNVELVSCEQAEAEHQAILSTLENLLEVTTVSRLKELVEADYDGRCVILPREK